MTSASGPIEDPGGQSHKDLKDPSREYCLRLVDEFLRLRDLRDEEGNATPLAKLPDWAESVLGKSGLKLSSPPREEILQDLLKMPRLQAALASSTSYTPSKWLLERELSLRIARSSGAHLIGEQSTPSTSDSRSWSPGKGDVYETAADEALFGLCCSGGGIRSATFSLGILQALAEAHLLDKVTYLSTVSGGGYIHQWLAAWIYRAGSLEQVAEAIRPIPSDESQAKAPDPINWLRRYSSYLTPQRGLLSIDTWTMVAIWFRNTFLNQIVLFAFLASCLMVMRTASFPFMRDQGRWNPAPREFGILVLLLVLMSGLASYLVGRALDSQTNKPESFGVKIKGALSSRAVVGFVVAPGFLLAILLTWAAAGQIRVLIGGISDSPLSANSFELLSIPFALNILGLLFAVTFGGEVPKMWVTFRKSTRPYGWIAGLLFTGSAVTCTILTLWAAWYLAGADAGLHFAPLRGVGSRVVSYVNQLLFRTSCTAENAVTGRGILTVFGPAIFFFLQFLAIRLHLGIIGRFYTEARREWLARVGAWAAVFALGWMGLVTMALAGPVLFNWFFQANTLRWLWGTVGVALLHYITLRAGASGKSDGQPKPTSFLGRSPMDIIAMVGAPACIFCLLVIISGLVDNAVQHFWPHLGYEVLCFLAVFITFIFFGMRIDVNAFSMHGFYRDRLARCYIGASNSRRTPDPFTGFDGHDETGTGIDLHQLLPVHFVKPTQCPDGTPPKPTYDGPFPIFCSTINLTFGQDLAWQERKGASFAFTPLYSGYDISWTAALSETGKSQVSFNGYVPTLRYAYEPCGVSLASVTAISGAALSPNMGFSTIPSVAFLMTLFNVRLGFWLANPRKPHYWPNTAHMPTPLFPITYLLRELFGLADDASPYICLSDGGRFEDMGLYELVRRRCRLIVVCDGEQENGDLQGIGGAIAKCRTDFGAEIDLDLNPLIPDPITGRSAEHFRVGTIRYPAPQDKDSADPKYRGNVIYLKTTYCGDEPGDILHHKLTDPSFPQDTTLNQWFSESDFESYRRLGQFIGCQAEEAVTDCASAIVRSAEGFYGKPWKSKGAKK